MHPRPFSADAAQGMIERVDLLFDVSNELRISLVAKRDVALHGKIRQSTCSKKPAFVISSYPSSSPPARAAR
jgi:hypothetical protein